MAELGHGSQIVNVTDSHSYELDEHELEQILMKEEVKDLPVVVVAVAGAYRGGKSFLLNFFIRYLKSTKSAREDGSWLGENSEPLAGFQWRSGIKRTTIGVLMWSEPFVTTLSSGEQVAVLLIDTQGTFDSKSTVRDCSTIFALSTLVSSVQIYNVSRNIQEDDMQNLQLFTEYGRLVKDQGSKPFQVLEFLVRDWQFPYDHPYGAAGGDQFLQDKLAITADMPKELQDLRKHISESFEKVSCFLMPHPGFEVLSSKFKGEIADIDIKFRTHLKDLVASLFGPEKLLPKVINGERVKAKDLFNYFKTYMTMFNSDTIPTPTSILQATQKAGFLTVFNGAREVYENGMDSECGTKQPSMPVVDVEFLHNKYLPLAREYFTSKKKMGSNEEANDYLEKLATELEKRLPQFKQINVAKTELALTKANELYEVEIDKLKKDQTLCVHPDDLERAHREGVDAATKSFEAGRKRFTTNEDNDRTRLVQTLESKLDHLRLTNNQNNEIVIITIRLEFMQTLTQKTNVGHSISEGDLVREYWTARNKAIEEFKSKRTFPGYHYDDVYKNKLTTKLSSIFNDIKAINRSRIQQEEQRRRAEEYEEYMRREAERRRREREEQERRNREWRRQQEERERQNNSGCYIL